MEILGGSTGAVFQPFLNQDAEEQQQLLLLLLLRRRQQQQQQQHQQRHQQQCLCVYVLKMQQRFPAASNRLLCLPLC
jgi:type II secretory pathway pseudopilin PulG